MSQHSVCLSFDFDAMSGFVARGFKSPTPVSRGEFGNIGAQRILDLLAKHAVPSTWFVPGVVVKPYPETCRRIVAEGHELAHHGWTHVPPSDLSRAKEAEGLKRGNDAIAEITGMPAKGYRSPSWDLSEDTVDLLLAHGFRYDSSMMGHDYQAYYARTGDQVFDEEPMVFGELTKLVELPVSWSLDDHPHFEFYRSGDAVMPGLRNASGVLENWLDDFRFLLQLEAGVMTVTCHPYVSGRGHRMLMLERFIVTLKELGAGFCSAIEAVERFDRAP